jgi:hypothetical protein
VTRYTESQHAKFGTQEAGEKPLVQESAGLEDGMRRAHQRTQAQTRTAALFVSRYGRT